MHNLEKSLFFPLTQLIHFLTFLLVISRKEREREYYDYPVENGVDDVGFGVFGVKGGAKDAVFLELLSHHTVVDESCAMELRQNQPSDEHQFHRVPDRDPLKKRL